MSIVKPKTNTLNHLIYIKFPSSLMTSRDLSKWIWKSPIKNCPGCVFLCFHLLDLSFGCSPTKLILLRKNKLRKKKTIEIFKHTTIVLSKQLCLEIVWKKSFSSAYPSPDHLEKLGKRGRLFFKKATVKSGH